MECSSKKAAATYRDLYDHRAELWTFVRKENVEPTNNVSERDLRHAVLWRKTSGGTDSEEGSRFVERILTVLATCRRQDRAVLDYLAACHQAAIEGTYLAYEANQVADSAYAGLGAISEGKLLEGAINLTEAAIGVVGLRGVGKGIKNVAATKGSTLAKVAPLPNGNLLMRHCFVAGTPVLMGGVSSEEVVDAGNMFGCTPELLAAIAGGAVFVVAGWKEFSNRRKKNTDDWNEEETSDDAGHAANDDEGNEFMRGIIDEAMKESVDEGWLDAHDTVEIDANSEAFGNSESWNQVADHRAGR